MRDDLPQRPSTHATTNWQTQTPPPAQSHTAGADVALQAQSPATDCLYEQDNVCAQADKDDRDVEVECKCQLLLVLAEVTLDGSTPLICSPLFATLFCQAASGAVPITPHTKVSSSYTTAHPSIPYMISLVVDTSNAFANSALPYSYPYVDLDDDEQLLYQPPHCRPA